MDSIEIFREWVDEWEGSRGGRSFGVGVEVVDGDEWSGVSDKDRASGEGLGGIDSRWLHPDSSSLPSPSWPASPTSKSTVGPVDRSGTSEFKHDIVVLTVTPEYTVYLQTDNPHAFPIDPIYE